MRTDEDRQHARDYYHSRRKEVSEWRKKRKQGINNKCPDCDKLIAPASHHCHACHMHHTRGKQHYAYKGGSLCKRSGYIRIRVDGKTMREHRYVWEQTHKQKLPRGVQVHHLNGIRHDNRPENLVAITINKHPRKTFVKLLQERIRELEQLHLFPSSP